MGAPTVLLWVYWFLLCWLLLIIGQIAISEAGALVPCLPQQPGGICVYTGQDAKQACSSISFRAVGF